MVESFIEDGFHSFCTLFSGLFDLFLSLKVGIFQVQKQTTFSLKNTFLLLLFNVGNEIHTLPSFLTDFFLKLFPTEVRGILF